MVRKDFAIPKEFQKLIKALLGSESDFFLKSLQGESPASIRINPNKYRGSLLTDTIPWTSMGGYLNDRPVYTLDPTFHAGAYYVQEPSSMFLEQVVRQSLDLNQPITALDLCAAPGGKSTHLLSLLHSDSLLISNEVIRSRASILAENILKWGYPNVAVTNNDPSHFSKLKGLFDLIVVDAPCSGEGLFRKDPEALTSWSLDNVNLCALRQRRILKDIWPSLKQNGILIYSTCTYNSKEDEETMKWLETETNHSEFISLSLPPEWGVVESKVGSVLGYRLYPHKVKGEGFFISVLRKTEPQTEVRIHTKDTFREIPRQEQASIASWVKNPHEFKFIRSNTIIQAVPANVYLKLDFLAGQLNVILAGIPLATNKHGKLVPEHGAALSTSLNRDNFNTVELSREQALRYLRKDPLYLETAHKGFALAAYNQYVLGWVNLLNNRINNLYPSSWRVRMELP